MIPQQQRKHLDRIAHASVTRPSDTSSLDPDPSLSTSETSSFGAVLSVDVHEVASVVTIPLPCLQGIWTKATELLSTSGSTVPAPGYSSEARLVLSRSGKRPHLVLPCKAGGFKCDSDCANFKSLGICSHTVVVAHLNGQLSEFVIHIKKAKKKPNMMKLAVHGMPLGTGKKDSRLPRKRAKTQSIEDRIERFQTAQAAPNGPSVSIIIDSGHMPVLQPFLQRLHTRFFHHLGHTIHSPIHHSVSHTHLSPPIHRPTCQHFHQWFLLVLPYRPPAAATESPFTLVFITGNISVCAGCSSRYPKPATDPYDICVRHTEWRLFTVDGTPKSKFAPAYYHANHPCLQKNWPSFHASNFVIQPDVFQKLSDSHIHFLRQFGCYL